METIEAYRLINVFVGDFSQVEDARERLGGSEAPRQLFSVFQLRRARHCSFIVGWARVQIGNI